MITIINTPCAPVTHVGCCQRLICGARHIWTTELLKDMPIVAKQTVLNTELLKDMPIVAKQTTEDCSAMVRNEQICQQGPEDFCAED